MGERKLEGLGSELTNEGQLYDVND